MPLIGFFLPEGILFKTRVQQGCVNNSPRFLELDCLRGIAIICMASFHFLFDYNFFVSQQFDLAGGLWFWLGRVSAILFLLLAGISLSLRLHRKKLQGKKLVSDLVVRGLFIFGLGMLLTFFTLLVFPPYAILFGILHLIGLSTILAIPFLKQPVWAGIIGFGIAILGTFFYWQWLPFPKLLAFFPFSFSTFDYFPVFPWFGLVLIGIFLGNRFYPNGKPSFRFKLGSGNPLVRLLAWAGKNSLAIYFVHQPVLVGLLLLAA